MESGYVRLWRCSLESRCWNNEGLWKVWCWCLMKANYKERWEGISTGKGNTQVHLLPGQFIFGRNTAAKELKMSPSSVYDRMKSLEKAENLVITSVTHYSIVTICNWSRYQTEENTTQQATRQRTGSEPAANRHRQEGKESKEGKEEKIIGEKSSRFVPPTLDQVQEYCSERKNTVDPEKWFDYYTSNGWMVGKTKMKCWKAAIRTWEKNGFSNGAGKKEHKTFSEIKDEKVKQAMREWAEEI